MKILYLDEIDSTNDFCKANDDGQDLIVVAKSQSKGRGTKGRSFLSQEGGLYLSIMRHHTELFSRDAFKVMINTAVAVCKTIENCGLSPVIKWPNDVLINGRKVSGTLIENTFSGNRVARSIVGVGLNVNNTLSPELEQIATSLSQEKGKKLDLEKITGFFISALNDEYNVADYKKYINWFGLPITLVKGDEKLVVVAKDVALDGRLICQIDGKEVQVSSGEVTLRF